MRISTNLMSLASFTALSDVSNRLSKVSKKLATGLRINSASDDASGLAVSQKMRAQIRGLDRSAKNAQDGISLLQTAEGGIQEITSLLQRMRELSVQGANDVLTSEDRGHIQGEIDELSSQVDAIANQTQFNRKKLLNGDMSALWSTSTSHLSVVMPGSGRAGGTEEAAAVPSGNFRILFSTLDEGRENIQKSNILTLRNGTAGTGAVMDTGGAGLAAMSALNLAEGSWRLETRETPFGGIRYLAGGMNSSAAAVGGAVGVSPTPNTVAPGTYNVRLSDAVPMMADFDDALELGVVEGVNISSRGTSSDFDARFAVRADEAGTPSSTLVYRNDIPGGTVSAGGAGDVSLTVNQDSAVNLFTHYAVTGTDRRDLMAGDVVLTESYVTSRDAVMTVSLEYQAADDTEIHISYRSSGAGNAVTAVTTWQAASGASLDIGGTVISVGGMGMSDIRDAVNGAGIAGITASVDSLGASRRIILSNSSGGDVAVTETGVGPDGLGLAGVVADGGTAAGTFREYQRSVTLSMNGSGLADIAAGLDSLTGLSASVTGGGGLPASVQLAGHANYDVSLASAGQIAAELSLDHVFDGGGSHSSAQVWNGRGVIADTGGKNLADAALSIQNAVGGIPGMAAFAAGTTASGNLHGLSFSNAVGIYEISMTGRAIRELSTGVYGPPDSITVGRGGGFSTGNRVYVNHDVSVSTFSADAMEVVSALNSAVGGALGLDGLTQNNGISPFSAISAGASRQLRLSSVPSSGYRISVTGGSGGSLQEVWGGQRTVNRGGTSFGQVLDYGKETVFAVTGMNMEEAFGAISSDGRLSLNWLTEPSHTAGEHEGRIAFTNVSAGAGRRVFSMAQAGTDQGNVLNAERTLFDSTGPFWSPENDGAGTVNSRTLQAHDRFSLQVAWDGNRASDASRYQGSASAWLWEGGTAGGGTSGQNAAALSGALGLPGFFTGFVAADGDAHGPDLVAGDSWMTYTTARVAGTADRLELSLYDGLYADGGNNGGVTEGIVYAFDDGALDDRFVSINQLVRTAPGIGGSENLSHRLDFGSVSQNTTLSYGERGSAGTYWENTGGSPSWYSHSYYAGDTTCFFGSGGSPSDIVRNAEVYRQNDINASLLFEFDGAGLTVRAKGFDRNGSELPESADTSPWSFPPAVFSQLASGADVTLFQGTSHEIRCTNLQVATDRLSAGDKFVINVAAAAKLDGLNTSPSLSGGFLSAANVAVEGDPFRVQSGEWGSSAQYRLADGAENGADLNLLGYFVDPLNGRSDVPGLGYYTGTLILQAEAAGFAPGSTVGAPDGTDAGSRRVRAEINYQGDARPSAGALVTSAFFGDMEAGGETDLKRYIGGVGYSNYLYGRRGDGTYGPLNEPGAERYNPYNASLVFDVISVENGSMRFRVQGHVIGRDGRQWYAEEEHFGLNDGQNTAKNSAALPPVIPSEVVNPVVLFRDSGFGGLFFDEFTLGDSSLWNEGDRFTLSLAASGFTDGISEADQLSDPLQSPASDELDLFSDNRGTNMPHSLRFSEGVLDNARVDIGIYQVANNLARRGSGAFAKDQVMDGTLSLSFSDFHPSSADVEENALTFESVFGSGMDAGPAHYYSRLSDIGLFYDGNGRFLLEGDGGRLTIRQGERETHVTVGAGMEVGQMAEYISRQIWLDLLGQEDGIPRGEGSRFPEGSGPRLMDRRDMNRIFRFIQHVPGQSGNDSVVSTLLAHSVLPGEERKLRFYGSEDLLKAFGFASIQEGEKARMMMRVTDAHSGKSVSPAMAAEAGSRVYGLLPAGVELDVESEIGLDRILFDRRRGTFGAQRQDVFSHVVHIADSSGRLQIGANEGEDMMFRLGDMSLSALGLESLDVRDREGAVRSIGRIDRALDRASSQRAVIGARISRLEHTVNNLSTSSRSLTAAESRILDADVAREMMEFVKLGILLQAGMSVAAQANQLPRHVLELLGR